MSVRAAMASASAMLTREGIEGAARDVRALMAAALGIEPGRMTLHLSDPLGEEQEAVFWSHVQRRRERVPVSQIVGWRMFYGRRFIVTGDVLDPRPETETLIAAALDAPWQSVLDLGTGSGAILLTLLAERDSATGTGTDLSPKALQVAERNARALGVAGRCALELSDWFGAVAGVFDLIVSNPPYIAESEMATLAPELAHEPRMALSDGADGLGAYRIIAAQAGAHLAAGGRLIVEIGHAQGAEVAALLRAGGLDSVRVRPDMDGRDRIVSARKPG